MGERSRFGRKADHSIRHDDQVSKAHFLVDFTGKRCIVRDLGSTNGTYVNDERQVEISLQTGDIIRAGRTRLQVEIEGMVPIDDDAPPTGPPPLVLPEPVAGRPFEDAFVDEAMEVRRSSLLAAAWGRQTWLLDYCRDAVKRPDPENWTPLLLLAILGEPSDLSSLLSVGRANELGPSRFRILGAFGHPGLMEELLVRLENKDEATAIAAATAIRKIIGLEVPLRPVAAESEQIARPDAKAMRRLWDRAKGRFVRGTRFCRGLDISRVASARHLLELDLESCWEANLRDHYRGSRNVHGSGPVLFESVLTVGPLDYPG